MKTVIFIMANGIKIIQIVKENISLFKREDLIKANGTMESNKAKEYNIMKMVQVIQAIF